MKGVPFQADFGSQLYSVSGASCSAMSPQSLEKSPSAAKRTLLLSEAGAMIPGPGVTPARAKLYARHSGAWVDWGDGRASDEERGGARTGGRKIFSGKPLEVLVGKDCGKIGLNTGNDRNSRCAAGLNTHQQESVSPTGESDG